MEQLEKLIFDTDIIVAVDFDGTLTKEDNIFNKHFDIDMNAIQWLRKIMDLPVITILWTCREGEKLSEAINSLKEIGINFKYVNQNTGKRNDPRKIAADYYIDDKSICGKIDWELFYETIKRRCAINE